MFNYVKQTKTIIKSFSLSVCEKQTGTKQKKTLQKIIFCKIYLYLSVVLWKIKY